MRIPLEPKQAQALDEFIKQHPEFDEHPEKHKIPPDSVFAWAIHMAIKNRQVRQAFLSDRQPQTITEMLNELENPPQEQ